MIVDTSAFVAILLKEPGHETILDVLCEQDHSLSVASLLELYMVVYNRKGVTGWQETETLLRELSTTLVPVTEAIARRAIQGFATYGKGQGNKAQLNYGDCFSYALAEQKKIPLLFKGNDFRKTDITPAISD